MSEIVLCAYRDSVLAAIPEGRNAPCDRCGADIVIGSGSESVPDPEFICPRCLLDDPNLDLSERGRVSDASRRAIRERFGREQGDALIEQSVKYPVAVIAQLMETERRMRATKPTQRGGWFLNE